MAGWRFLAPFLGENGLRVCCQDMPAFGLSDDREEHRPRVIHDFVDFVDFVHEFTSALCLDRFHLTGNSMGCMNTANYTVAHPDRVIGFVLIAGAIGDVVQATGKPKTDVELTRCDGTPEGMRRMMESISHRVEASSDDLVAMRYRAAERGKAGHVSFWPSLLQYSGFAPWEGASLQARLSTKGRLDKFDVPGICLYGIEDVLTPVEWGFGQEKWLPKVQRTRQGCPSVGRRTATSSSRSARRDPKAPARPRGPRRTGAYLFAAFSRWAAVSPRRPTGTTPVAAPRPYAGMSTYTDS
ncbi:alpha/beta fold hydrolase [Streptomyces fuscichromogenes]|nr:alpha/beta fold hydrolase [Streptomyces fuscichromogenes]